MRAAVILAALILAGCARVHVPAPDAGHPSDTGEDAGAGEGPLRCVEWEPITDPDDAWCVRWAPFDADAG